MENSDYLAELVEGRISFIASNAVSFSFSTFSGRMFGFYIIFEYLWHLD